MRVYACPKCGDTEHQTKVGEQEDGGRTYETWNCANPCRQSNAYAGPRARRGGPDGVLLVPIVIVGCGSHTHLVNE